MLRKEGRRVPFPTPLVRSQFFRLGGAALGVNFIDRKVTARFRPRHNDLMRRFSARRVAGRKLLTPLLKRRCLNSALQSDKAADGPGPNQQPNDCYGR